MRHVKYDPAKIDYPPGWQNRAKDAFDNVKAVPPEKRSEEVNKYQSIWAELRPELKKIMHGKCWYTEALQIGTDSDVDHFRPKNSVKGCYKPGTKEPHPGYWWKAFDPTNYRFSCIVANRLRRDVETGFVGGKADEFPIWDETYRAWTENDDCNDEQPLLIDPCKSSEVALIMFGEDGEAKERIKESEKPRLYKKAHCSIVLYHINHTDFVKARIELRDRIKKLIEDAHRYYKRLDAGDANNDNAYDRTIEQLRDVRSEKAPFSGFAIAMLEPYQLDESLKGVFLGS
jgi:hypothetical protein